MNFSSAAKLQMEGGIVRVCILVEFRFLTGDPVRLWEGFGPLKTLDDRVWSGTGGLGSVSGIGQSINGTAPSLTLSLSGVDAQFYNLAKGERSEWFNRALVVYLQFHDEDWACLDNPYAIQLARMTNLASEKSAGPDGPVYTVTVVAETPFATRRRPKYSFWTDRDQQRRFPGDRGLERVAGIDNKNIRFPDY